MGVAAFAKFQPATFIGDFLTDILNGLNVREKNYLDPESSPPVFNDDQGYPWEGYEPIEAWIVEVWHDANEEERWPWEETHSIHRTQKGAEMEAAYLEIRGFRPGQISVNFGWTHPLDYDRKLQD